MQYITIYYRPKASIIEFIYTYVIVVCSDLITFHIFITYCCTGVSAKGNTGSTV